MNRHSTKNIYIDNPDKQKYLYKRSLIIIVIAQILGGAGLAAGITVGSLLAKDMLGTNSLAGLPIALFTFGSAGAALLVGNLSQRFGRRVGLTVGFMVGAIGAVGVIISADINNVILLFISLLIYGAGTATNLQARYAGTDLATVKQRATAISIALVSTTFGAVAGPNLVNVMGKVALSIGFPSLAGPFILAAVAFFLAGIILFIFLRPDPLIIAQTLVTSMKQHDDSAVEEVLSEKNTWGITVGAIVMVVTQIVMVAVMTMTPVQISTHGHGLSAVGLIIGFHIGAMYLPSLVTGYLVDKIGRHIMAIASGLTLLLSGILAAFAPTNSVTILTVALILLGLGWNFGLISGTALIVDATTPSNRAKIQGTVDVLIALSGAAGGALSGIVVAHSSYMVLSLSSGVLSLILVPIVLFTRRPINERNKATAK